MIGMASFASERAAGLDSAFDDLPGVLATHHVGLGGRPVVRVEFDPEAVSYEQVLDRVRSLDEPAPGIRAASPSAVLVHSSEQEALANAARQRRGLLLGRPVLAAVVRAGRRQAASARRSASQAACQARSAS